MPGPPLTGPASGYGPDSPALLHLSGSPACALHLQLQKTRPENNIRIRTEKLICEKL